MTIPIIQQHDNLIQAVSARGLHDFLGITERFSTWFDRMLAYGFSESSDFEKCKTFNASNRELEDYFISIDMANHWQDRIAGDVFDALMIWCLDDK